MFSSSAQPHLRDNLFHFVLIRLFAGFSGVAQVPQALPFRFFTHYLLSVRTDV